MPILASSLSAQIVPDVLYYRFNEGAGAAAANSAVPGAGSPSASLYGSIGWGAGQFGSGLSATGATGANQGVNTGYTLNLTGQSWTLEFWIKPNATSATLNYIFGVNVGVAFRCFHGAVPGTGNLTLTGSGLGTINAAGAVANAGTWTHVAYVFDNSTAPPTVTPYVNAVAGAPVNQTGTLTLNTGALTIGSQLSGSAGLNGVMDEFRLWLTARTAAQIQASYNTRDLPVQHLLSAQTTGGGTGDLVLSLTAITPGAVEGYTLVTSVAPGIAGSGPLFGIWPSAITFDGINSPAGVGNPLHFILGIPGVFPDLPFGVPPGTLSILGGQTWDMVAVVLGPGLTYLGHSVTQRLAW